MFDFHIAFAFAFIRFHFVCLCICLFAWVSASMCAHIATLCAWLPCYCSSIFFYCISIKWSFKSIPTYDSILTATSSLPSTLDGINFVCHYSTLALCVCAM